MQEHAGLLVVHGIGEQKRFETTRQLVQSILAGLGARDDGSRYSLVDRTANPTEIPINCPHIDRSSGPFTIACEDAAGKRTTHLHVHEVWWSDLGAPSSFSEQVRFWLWGLGQWCALVIWSKHDPNKPSNTELLMTPPTKFRAELNAKGKARNKSKDKTQARPIARFLLFLSGLYALFTLFSWEAVKRVFSWLSDSAGSPSILTAYVGDVRIYTQAPGKGGGNLTDLGQPWRTTIRRRMISELIAMAERDYDRWYVLGHSLGSIVAFNGVQEPEWNLPNYLDPAQTDRLRASATANGLWVTTPPAAGEPQPNLHVMMPRRPVWLGPTERISRKALFKTFNGMITYGSPLDKFAALWPRIVPINKQRDVFDAKADWVNLSDATDPVGAQVGAFEQGWRKGTPAAQSPFNVRVRASAFFLLSHIRYFGAPTPHKTDRPETRALVEVLFPGNNAPPRLTAAFADVGKHYGKPYRRVLLTIFWVILLGAVLVTATSWLAILLKRLIDAGADKLSQWLTNHWPSWDWLGGLSPKFPSIVWKTLMTPFEWVGSMGFGAVMLTTLIVGATVVGLAGAWRWRSGE
ncbi:MAG: hypothetical protein J7485_02855 [Sphingobium sp.]|nr:hypothetical protein [Sphingobium sp.]